MLLVVGTIGMLVHYYSIGYMRGDEGYYRFFAYLNLFMFAMFILVLANNYLLMFLAWEGVGLCSYLLISFWFTRKAPSQAGKKAFLVNRIGDFGFMLGMLLMFLTFGSLQFTHVFAKAGSVGGATMLGICLLLFAGAVGKSAQFPLHVWLPDAMEGPTPVSALIHAATMVNAGVYMVARSYPLFIHSHAAMLVVMGIGAFTAIYAAGIALTQNDIKKVIAYSTVSQLGYMFMALGAGAWAAGIFHLFTHGFFKGLLFLGAGSVIHAMGGEQDMRKMGGLRKLLPVTYWTMIVGALANAGIFPLAGFFSKDEILGADFNAGYWFIWIVGIITAFLTAFYMFRLIFMTFHNQSRADAETQAHIHESPRVMSVPLVLLAIPAALAGIVAGWPPDGGWIHKFLEPVFFNAKAEVVPLARAGRRPAADLAGRGARRHRHGVRLLHPPPGAAGASRRAPALGLPGVGQQVLHGRVLREGGRPADRSTAPTGCGPSSTSGSWTAPSTAWPGCGRGWPRILRPLQTGRAQNYAFGILIGVLVLVVAFKDLLGAAWAGIEQIGFPILSVITYLPLAGVAVALLFGKNRPLVYKVAALASTFIAFVLSAVMLLRFHTGLPGMQFVEDFTWIGRLNIHYGFGVDGIAALLIFLTELLGVIVVIASWNYIKDRERGFFISLLLLQTGMTGRLQLHRPLPLLRVLGGHAGADVLHHRYLGRAAEGLRRHQVLPLHPRRQPADAGGHHRRRPVREEQHRRGSHLQHPAALSRGLSVRPAALGVPGLLHRLRHQGADVPGAHVAAGRARRSAHGRLGHPGRRAAEDGRVRHPALLPAHVPGRRP